MRARASLREVRNVIVSFKSNPREVEKLAQRVLGGRAHHKERAKSPISSARSVPSLSAS